MAKNAAVNGPGWALCVCGHDVSWHHGVYGCCWQAEGDDSWPGTDGCRRWQPETSARTA